VASACAPDANCFFGPPVEVNGFPSTCVVNTFAQDASGTVNTATGESSVSINLASPRTPDTSSELGTGTA
jgi:hypothetical protein